MEERLQRFGAYIRLLRESEGLSQEELAKKSGFAGRAAISAIEKEIQKEKSENSFWGTLSKKVGDMVNSVLDEDK